MKVFVLGVLTVAACASAADLVRYEWANASTQKPVVSNDTYWAGGQAPQFHVQTSGANAEVDFAACPYAPGNFGYQYLCLPPTNCNTWVGKLIGDNRRYFNYPINQSGTYISILCQRTGLSLYVDDPNEFYGRIGMNDRNWYGSQNPKRPGIVLSGADGAFVPVLHDALVHGRPHFCVPDGGSAIFENPVGDGPFDVNLKPTSDSYGDNRTETLFAGTLTISNSPGPNATVFLHGGTLRLAGVAADRPQGPVAGAVVHLDASAEGGVESDGSGTVSRWADLSGHGNDATPDLSRAAAPKFVADGNGAGLAVVDFGAFKGSHDCRTPSPESIAQFGDPAGLCFPQRIPNLKEVFVVYTENQASNSFPSVIGSDNDLSAVPPFYRTGVTADNGVYPLVSERNYNNWAIHGEIRWDGQRIEAASTPRNAAYGYHVFSVGLTNGCPGGTVRYVGMNRFNENTSYPYDKGGARIGEILFYDRALTSSERRQVNAYLKRKWGQGQNAEDWDLGNLKVEKPATIDVPEGRVARIAALDLGGSGVTLTKTGKGRLVIGRVTPETARVATEDGVVQIVGMTTPAEKMASDPRFWLDATQIPREFLLSSNDVQGVARTFVTAWPDARGVNHLGQTLAAARCALNPNNKKEAFVDYGKYMAYATLRDGARAGCPMVDFGTFNPTNYNNYLTQHAAWESTGSDTAFYRFQTSTVEGEGDKFLPYLREFFMVVSLKDKRAQLLGQVDNTMETQRDQNHSTQLISPAGDSGVIYGGTWYIDGKEVDPLNTTVPVGTCMVLSAAFAGPVNPRAIGSDRGYSNFGGLQIGEYLMYDRRLTPEERRETTRYLMRKWLGKDHPDVTETQPVGVTGIGAYDIRQTEGAGADMAVEASADGLPNFTAVAGEAGYTVAHPALSNLLKGARTHLDATATRGFTYSGVADYAKDAEGDRYITHWNDLNGSGRFLVKMPRESEATERRSSDQALVRYVQAYPTVKNYTCNGVTRPYVDLGEFSSALAADSTEMRNENGYFNSWGTRPTTAAMKGDSTAALSGREYHVVFGDAHPNTEGHTWKPSILARGNCLSDPNYMPGRRGIDGKLFAQNNRSTVAFRDGWIWADNVKTNSTYTPDWGDVHVYTIMPTNAFGATPSECTGVYTLGCDGYLHWGGSRYGEIVVFSGATNTAEDRAEIDAYLLKKWTGRGRGATVRLGDVAVAADAKLTLASADFGNFFTATSLGGAGTLALGAADTITTDALAVDLGRTLTVAGAFAFAENGVLTVRGTVRPKSGEYVLFAAASLEDAANFANWRVVLGFPCRESDNLSVVVKGDSLVLKVPPRGLTVIFR